jgi:hypothetical protein
MTSQSGALLDVRPPRYLTRPEAISSAGQEAVELAASAGLVLDPWEAEVLDVALGERGDGTWAASEVGVIVPRQNGKGAILEARELAGLFLFKERLILHSAHEFKTSSEAFLRIMTLIEQTDDLNSRVLRVLRSHDQGIVLKGGQRLLFIARSSGSGRGFGGDTVILDEAFNLPDAALAALLPTLSARPNPQLWYTSSAPLAKIESNVLRRLCKRGRAGTDHRLAYIEHSADPEADRDDRVAWQEANPAFAIRISEEFIERERAALTDEDFARERLGIWFDTDLTHRVIPAEAWVKCRDPKSGPVGPLSFALDVAPDRASAAFAVAGTSGRGGVHVEVVDHRPGTSWVVERAKELQGRWDGGLAIAEGAPAWSLESELRAADVGFVGVKPSEHVQACGQIYDAVIEANLRHLGQPELNRAVGGADRRPSGDAWLWSRKASTVDICPLVAVTLALGAHMAGEDISVYNDRGFVAL